MEQAPTVTLENNQVVKKTTIDLSSYIKAKQFEIANNQQNIALAQGNIAKIIAELSNLIPKSNA